MNIAGFTMSTPWASRSLWSGFPVEEISDIPCEMKVSMDSVFFSYGSEEVNYRPRLHMRGKLISIIPAIEMPLNITEISFDPESGPIIDGFYSFTDDQLAVLVQKGYFTYEFDIPALFSETVWELPTTIDALLVPGDAAAEIAPAIFVDIHDQLEMSVDMNNSGYNLSEEFSDVRQQSFDLEERTHNHEYEHQLVSDGASLFGDDIFDEVLDNDDENAREQMVTAGLVDAETGKLTAKAGRFQELLEKYASENVEDIGSETEELVEDVEDDIDTMYANISAAIYDSLKAAKVASVINEPGSEVTVEEDITLDDDAEPGAVIEVDKVIDESRNRNIRAKAVKEAKTRTHAETLQQLENSVPQENDYLTEGEDLDLD